MASLKSITDLPMAENANGVNLIVNDNGMAKQASLDSIRAEQEYDLVFEYNWHPSVQGGELEYLKTPSQEKFKLAVEKIEKAQMVKAMFRFNSTEGGYGQRYYAEIPMHLSCYQYNKSADCFCEFIFEDEGTIKMLVHVSFDENGVTHFSFGRL